MKSMAFFIIYTCERRIQMDQTKDKVLIFDTTLRDGEQSPAAA
jgi:hypothetical protein